MPLSVAVSRAEVASSQISSRGRLLGQGVENWVKEGSGAAPESESDTMATRARSWEDKMGPRLRCLTTYSRQPYHSASHHPPSH
jgi:hypothetical protein